MKQVLTITGIVLGAIVLPIFLAIVTSNANFFWLYGVFGLTLLVGLAHALWKSDKED